LIEDWDKFINLCYSHGVFPLVYNSIKNFQKLIPEDILKKLKYINMDIVKQNMLMTSELIRVIKLLEDNGIEAISFKGPTLSRMAYGDITLRQYVDLDILVKKVDLKRTINLLLKNSFLSSKSLDLFDNELYLEIDKDFTLINKKNGVNLELHWNIFDKTYDFSNDKLIFDSLDRVLLNNKKIKTFSNEILLVYLCIHGSKHKWERIEWIKDIDLLIRNSDIDYSKIKKQFLNNYSFLLGLYLASYLFDTPIDKYYQEKTNQRKVIKLSKNIIKEFNNRRQIEDFKYYLELFIFHLKLLTLKEKFVFIKNKIFNVTSVDLEIYPNVKSKYLFIFLKPYRLLSKYLFFKNKKSN